MYKICLYFENLFAVSKCVRDFQKMFVFSNLLKFSNKKLEFHIYSLFQILFVILKKCSHFQIFEKSFGISHLFPFFKEKSRFSFFLFRFILFLFSYLFCLKNSNIVWNFKKCSLFQNLVRFFKKCSGISKNVCTFKLLFTISENDRILKILFTI